MPRLAIPAPIRCDPDISVGPSPDIGQIRWLARRGGIHALLDLNEEGEPGQVLSPNVAASWAHTLELAHERVSISLERPAEADVERFLTTLRAIPKPVYVHSASGERAAALVTIWFGIERGMCGVDALAFACALGLTRWSAARESLVVAQIDRRGAQHAGCAPAASLSARGAP
jgi:protein tyrosine phosphatase (PTP) superfamily phosphohydrolase (DUF442 family)